LILLQAYASLTIGADLTPKPREFTQRSATGTKGRRLPDRIVETSSVVMFLLLGVGATTRLEDCDAKEW
jgi:hypothetical protein